MDPREQDLLAPELDFVPLEDELENDAAGTAEELELLFSRVRAARFAGA